MTFVNLTPHEITIVGGETDVRVAPSGSVARCAQKSVVVGTVEGVSLNRTEFGAVEGLPAPVEGTIFIVSALVRTAVPSRTDVASPGELVRNAAGQPVGCKGLVVNLPPSRPLTKAAARGEVKLGGLTSADRGGSHRESPRLVFYTIRIQHSTVNTHPQS